jgi:CubicO group peptidase (beta-lactamase class C family)
MTLRRLAIIAALSLADAAAAQERPGLLENGDLGRITADLSAYTERRMRQAAVPGVSIAIIQHGRVAWTKGFGISNSISRSPVVPETVFPVASNGKAVTAYLALLLADDGLLSLDRPLVSYLEAPWLGPSDWSVRITARHVLAHTSGLSNVLADRRRIPRSAPGEAFAYSGVGFMYLQRALEQVTETSLDSLTKRYVFQPLAMRRSYFGRAPLDRSPSAAAHLTVFDAIAPFAFLALPIALAFTIVMMIACRVLLKTWRAPLWTLAATLSLAVITTVALLTRLAGRSTMPLYFASVSIWFLAIPSTLALLARRRGRADRIKFGPQLMFAISLAVTTLAFRSALLPLPHWFPRVGNAAGSLHASAPDLATFLIRVAQQRQSGSGPGAAMARSQIAISPQLSWGLGLGILAADRGECLWHWGSNPGSRSLMVIYPDAMAGIVVLANGPDDAGIVYDIAARALNVRPQWRIG